MNEKQGTIDTFKVIEEFLSSYDQENLIMDPLDYWNRFKNLFKNEPYVRILRKKGENYFESVFDVTEDSKIKECLNYFLALFHIPKQIKDNFTIFYYEPHRGIAKSLEGHLTGKEINAKAKPPEIEEEPFIGVTKEFVNMY